MRIGLVLGGGGTVGAAYHAGALTALEHDLGWDPRRAEVIVGTSAGSLVGALLRVGVPASDLAAHLVEAHSSATHPLVTGRRVTRPQLPQLELGRLLLQGPRLPSPALVGRWVRRPWAVSPMGALVSVLPDGVVPLRDELGFLHEAEPGWPEDELWICTARRSDLRRTIFGRNHLMAPLATAVAASCAIPGYLSPVRIGTDAYVDGGVHSPTNADVLRDEGLDLVLVLSPMSAERPSGWGPEAVVRRHAHRRLVQERRRIERAGTPTVAFAPGERVLAHTGLDFMSADKVVDLVGASFLDTGRQVTEGPARELLAPLRRPRRGRPSPIVGRSAAAPGRAAI